MFNCQNSEGVHPYLLKCCGDTCSFVGMLKGCIVRKSLGTPALENNFSPCGQNAPFFRHYVLEIIATRNYTYPVTMCSVHDMQWAYRRRRRI